MNVADLEKLESLFKETGGAHHRAFEESEGADPEWPTWYSGHLQDTRNEMFGATITKSELVYLLVAAEKERDQRAPGAHWPRYYAKFFLERYS